MEVLGISCITNLAAGMSDQKLSHDEVKDTATRVEAAFSGLILDLLPRLACADACCCDLEVAALTRAAHRIRTCRTGWPRRRWHGCWSASAHDDDARSLLLRGPPRHPGPALQPRHR
jgi:hypothetical protein